MEKYQPITSLVYSDKESIGTQTNGGHWQGKRTKSAWNRDEGRGRGISKLRCAVRAERRVRWPGTETRVAEEEYQS